MLLTLNAKDYSPHQFQFLKSKAQILALVTGFGAGKTYAFRRKCLINHLFNISPESGLSNGWVIYPTLELAHELFVEDFKILLQDLEIPFNWNVQRGRFKTPYGTIKIYTLEQPKRMVGANLTWCGFDEFDTVKTSQALLCFQKAVGRMRGNATPQIFIVTTPEGFKATYKLFVENKKPSHELIRGRTEDNKHLDENYLRLLREQYDPILLKAYMEGQFVNLESGQVYYSFNRELHVAKENIAVNPTLPLNFCFDFNVFPYSVSWNQEYNREHIRWLGEWVSKAHSNTHEACAAITAMLPRDLDVVVYGDASGRSGSANSNLTNYQIIDSVFRNHFKDLTYHVPTSNPAVKDRINCFNLKLSKNHLVFNPSCVKLIQDLEQVVWNEKGNELDKSDIHRTHSSDGAGYYISYNFPIIDLPTFKQDKFYSVAL